VLGLEDEEEEDEEDGSGAEGASGASGAGGASGADMLSEDEKKESEREKEGIYAERAEKQKIGEISQESNNDRVDKQRIKSNNIVITRREENLVLQTSQLKRDNIRKCKWRIRHD
jgi:UDP-N-acetylglucosamine pyrophosphorylase